MIFILLYVAYLVFLYFDPPIKSRMETLSVCYTHHGQDSDHEYESTSKRSSAAENTPIFVDQKWKTSSFGADDNDEDQEQTGQLPTINLSMILLESDSTHFRGVNYLKKNPQNFRGNQNDQV